MKKFICLALSLMMVMSLVTVPVMAEDAATATTTYYPEPDIHLTAATVNNTGTYNESTGKMSGHGTTWYPVLLNTVNGNNANRGVRIHNNMGGNTIESNMNGVYVYDADTAAEGTVAWNGFKMDATQSISIANLDKGYYGATAKGMTIATNTNYSGKNMRADSVRFRMPTTTGEEANKPMTLLFGSSNSGYFNQSAINGTKTLRLYDGGAYTVDMSTGSSSWYNFLPAETTMVADKWYRAERIIDTRIDAGTSGEGTENWQRFIIFDDATNAVIGDSGWVMVGTTTKAAGTSAYFAYPFNNMSFAAINYNADTYLYIDDIKSWAIDAPLADYVVGEDDSDSPKYLTFPMDAVGSYRDNWAVYYCLRSEYYYGGYNAANKYPSGVYPENRPTQAAFANAIKNVDYLYLETDFMIPEANTTEFGILGFDRAAAHSVRQNQRITSPIRVKNGVLTVSELDADAANFVSGVKNADGNDFELTLTPGKWYTAKLKIDQSMYADGMYTVSTDSYGKDMYYDANGEQNGAKMTSAQTTLATVEITDEEGNTYTTEEFKYLSPYNYIMYGTNEVVLLVDALPSASSSTAKVSGFKVSVDNFKYALSNGAIDAEDAIVVIDEDFQTGQNGATFETLATRQLNPQHDSNVSGPAQAANELAYVEADRTKTTGVPELMQILLGGEIKCDAETLANAVKLYQGETEANELIESLAYDDASNTLTVNFTALEPETAYTISIGRAATEMEGNIFSVLPGDNGKTAEFSFTTGYMISDKLRFTPKFTYPMLGVGLEDMGGVYPYEIASSESTLKSYNEGSTAYVVVAAIYDANGKMEDIMAQTGTIEPGEPIPVDFGGDTILPVNGTTLKAFVWNTWSQMKPIGDIYVYPAAE